MEQAEYQVLASVEGRHWWHRGMRAIAAALLDRVYPCGANLRILDAGCGAGGSVALLRRYGSVIGLDHAPEAVMLARRTLSGALARASVLRLPFACASFDLVTSFDVLYHRGVPDEAQALREAGRVLRPGGRLLLRLPAYAWLYSRHDRAVHTRRRYRAAHVRELLVASGFGVEALTYVNCLLFPAVAAQRLAERWRPEPSETQSALELPPALLNAAMELPLDLEAAWLRQGGSLPFGLSVLALARWDA